MAEPLTHYVPFWNRPDKDGKAETICGLLIPRDESTALPSCDRCDAYFTVMTRQIAEEMRKP